MSNTNSSIGCGAIDVGSGRLKVMSAGKGKGSVNVSRPSLALPVELLPRNFSGEENHLIVDVDGEKWAAGIEPHAVPNFERELHANYSQTKQYKALMLAGLNLLGLKKVTHLVTGLPVNQETDPARKQELIDMVVGKHTINGEEISVENVMVVPQPVGAWADFASDTANEVPREIIETGVVLIFDPGNYSSDWVVFKAGRMLEGLSGSGVNAVSAILERAARSIAAQTGRSTSPARIEEVLLRDGTELFVGGEPVEIAEHVNKAAEEVAQEAFKEVRVSLRPLKETPDVVFIPGGGAPYFLKTAKETFPDTRYVHAAKMPSMSNVRGFLKLARLKNGK